MECQSIIYGSIVFLALIFGDLGVTGVAAISGPLAALILKIEAIRKHREQAGTTFQDRPQIPAPTLDLAHAHNPAATGHVKDSEQLACG
jgi:hypothetical protein